MATAPLGLLKGKTVEITNTLCFITLKVLADMEEKLAAVVILSDNNVDMVTVKARDLPLTACPHAAK